MTQSAFYRSTHSYYIHIVVVLYLAQYLTNKGQKTLFDVFMLIVVSMDEDQVGNRDYSMPRQARKSIAELCALPPPAQASQTAVASAEASRGPLNAASKPAS